MGERNTKEEGKEGRIKAGENTSDWSEREGDKEEGR